MIKISTQRLVKLISKDLETYASNILFEPNNAVTASILKSQVTSYLDQLKYKGIIYDRGDVETNIVTTHHTWTSLYPSPFKRVIAQLSSKILNTCEHTRKWYHSILPYRVEHIPMYDYDDEGNEIEGTERLEYKATLYVPYDEVHTYVTLDIAPIIPVEFINITLTIKQ